MEPKSIPPLPHHGSYPNIIFQVQLKWPHVRPTEPSLVFLLWVELGSSIKVYCRHSWSLQGPVKWTQFLYQGLLQALLEPLVSTNQKVFLSRTWTVFSKSSSLGECFLLHHLLSSVLRGNQTSGMRLWNSCTNLNIALNSQKCSKPAKRKQGNDGSMLPWRETQSESTVDFLKGPELK